MKLLRLAILLHAISPHADLKAVGESRGFCGVTLFALALRVDDQLPALLPELPIALAGRAPLTPGCEFTYTGVGEQNDDAQREGNREEETQRSLPAE